MRTTTFGLGAIVAGALLLAGPTALAQDKTIELSLQGDRFAPAEITVPAGAPLVFKLTNGEKSAVEFEAKDLKIEKVVPAGGSATVRVKALKPGRYLIVNEYREDVAKAYIVAE
jgi:hypothetical protein